MSEAYIWYVIYGLALVAICFLVADLYATHRGINDARKRGKEDR